MTVANSTMKWSAVGAGAVVAVPLTGSQVYDIDDLEVIVRTVATGVETPLTKTTDYTAAGIPGAAVTVTTVATYTSASEIHVRRLGDYTQTNDFVQADSFPDAVVEQIADEDTMTLQVLKDAVDRALKFAKTSDDANVEFPDLVANKYIQINGTADGFTLADSGTTSDARVNSLFNGAAADDIFATYVNLDDGALILDGAGTPEASVVAPVGSIYLRTDGGLDTSVYFKETGVDNTGWVTKQDSRIRSGSVSPEGAETAPVGTLYLKIGGAGLTDVYQKNTGAGNTGWRSLFRSEYNITIGEGGDYATLTAYIADSPTAGDRVYYDVDETSSVNITIPDNVLIQQAWGRVLTFDTAMASAALTVGTNTRLAGRFTMELTHAAGVIDSAVYFNGDEADIDDLRVQGTGAGTITDGVIIASGKTANRGFITLTNSMTFTSEFFLDSSADFSNYVIAQKGTNNINRSDGANKFKSMTIQTDSVVVQTPQSPASGDAGTVGEIAWDANYIYVCTASGVWKRAALTGGY